MRISEIKLCVEDTAILNCIRKNFWDDEYYRYALCQSESPKDVYHIYDVIKTAYLALIETDNGVYSNLLPKDNKKIKRLSKLIYGDSLYWAKGTSWEKIVYDRKAKIDKKILFKEKFDSLDFLYHKLNLKKRNNNYDLVHLIAKTEIFSNEIIKKCGQIETIEDLFFCCEQVSLNVLSERKMEYIEYRIIKSASYLAFNNVNAFLERNNLDVEKVVDNDKQYGQ